MGFFVVLDAVRYRALTVLADRAFARALPYFSAPVPGGWRVNLCWLYPWAVADQTGNRRFSYIAPAVRAAWPEFAVFDVGNFLPLARQTRYL
jgi:hypothetical protein